MTRTRTTAGRLVAVLFAAVTGTGSVITPAAPAAAAPLGTVAISQESGSVTDTPMFAGATTSAPCPAGFGANALIRIGPVDGPFTNLARPSTAGGYDRAPVAFRPDRSFQTALGQPPPEGAWAVVVECFSPDAGRIVDRFVTPVTVTGTSWRVGAPPAPGATAGAPGQANPSAGASGGASAGAVAPGQDAQSGGTRGDPASTRTSGERVLGLDGVPVELLIGGVFALVALAVGAVVLARRRRAGAVPHPVAGRRGGAGNQSSRGGGAERSRAGSSSGRK